MVPLAQAGLTAPAVAGQLERGVRPHLRERSIALTSLDQVGPMHHTWLLAENREPGLSDKFIRLWC